MKSEGCICNGSLFTPHYCCTVLLLQYCLKNIFVKLSEDIGHINIDGINILESFNV